MIIVDLLGHIFYAFIFVGMILLSRKNIWGWPTRFVGELGWLVLGIHLGLTSVWAWGILFVAMDIAGYYKWKAGR